jgi:hypothetical protein
MTRLTDIKTPLHYQPVKKLRRSFIKTFFKVITAPIWGPFYLVYLVLRVIKNLIVKIVSFIERGVWRGLMAIKNFWSAVTALIRGFIFGIPRLLPNSWAAWLVFLLAITVIWQTAMAWDFPLLNMLDYRQGKWQAVFLSNNQVYFGHLRNIYSKTAILEDVFYLRNREGDAGGVNLVKLGSGSELHDPENIMFIPREQIIFWENLKEDSQIVRAIKQMQ